MPPNDAHARSLTNHAGHYACAIPGCKTRVSRRNLHLCTDCWRTWGGPAHARPPWLRMLINLEERNRYRDENAPPPLSLEYLLECKVLDEETMVPYRPLRQRGRPAAPRR